MVTFNIPGYGDEPETTENDEPTFSDSMTESELRNAILEYSRWAVENLEPLADVDMEDVIVEISNMKTQAGKAIWKKSKEFYITRYSHRAYDDWGWEKFTSTIRHELIHIWQYQIHGDGNHGPTFKAKARKLGCSVHCETFHDDYKYKLYCRECDKMVGGRHKKSKTVKYPQSFSSKCCGAPIYVEKQ